MDEMDEQRPDAREALRAFVIAAEAMRAVVIDSLSEASRQQLGESIASGDVIVASTRVDHDLASGLPTFKYTVFDINGREHHVQTRNVVVPPPAGPC